MSLRSDIRPALTGVWLVLSAALGTAAMAPFLVPAEAMYGLFSECAVKARGDACPLCGMTTAYLLIARADFNGALASNGGSVALWTASLVNFSVAIAYMFAMLRRRHDTQGESPCN